MRGSDHHAGPELGRSRSRGLLGDPSGRRALRILLVSPSSVLGGAERVFVDLLEGLDEHDGADAVPVLLEPGPLVDSIRQVGREPILIRAGRVREVHRYASTVRQLRRLIVRKQCDVVVANMAKAHVYTGVAARLARTACAWSQVMIPDPPSLIDRVVSRIPADMILANSSAAKDAQERLSPSTPVRVVHPGIDVDRFRLRPSDRLRIRTALGVRDDALVVGMVGRLQPWKNQESFIRAARILADRHIDASFVIVGGAILGWEGDYPESLQRLIKELGLEDRVRMVGHQDDVPAWTNALDIAVNASDPEPFGLVITEAMACGRAVVAVDSGGPAEIIQHRRTGFLVDSPEPHVLADGIGELVVNSQLRQAIGEAAAQHVASSYSTETMVSSFLSSIAELSP